jgi:hypothetical protein
MLPGDAPQRHPECKRRTSLRNASGAQTTRFAPLSMTVVRQHVSPISVTRNYCAATKVDPMKALREE